MTNMIRCQAIECFACRKQLTFIDEWWQYSYNYYSPSTILCSLECLLRFSNKSSPNARQITRKSYLPSIKRPFDDTDRIETYKAMINALNASRKHHSTSEPRKQKKYYSVTTTKYSVEDWMSACHKLRQINNSKTSKDVVFV